MHFALFFIIMKDLTKYLKEKSRDKCKKTKYLLLPYHQNAGQNHDIKTVGISFENGHSSKYLGMTVTNQNLIQEAIKGKLNSGSACYHSVHKLLASHLLSTYVEISICKTIILFVVLYGCKT
jgi:hypothetical protein